MWTSLIVDHGKPTPLISNDDFVYTKGFLVGSEVSWEVGGRSSGHNQPALTNRYGALFFSWFKTEWEWEKVPSPLRRYIQRYTRQSLLALPSASDT